MGKMKRIFLLIVLCPFFLPPLIDGEEPQIQRQGSVLKRTFFYTANKWGIPILKASIKIKNGTEKESTPLLQIEAQVDSLPHLRSLFWMKNRFVSILDEKSGLPISYTKEIHQGGLLIKNKNYHQLITFDPLRQNVVIENGDRKEKRVLPVPLETYDPLSLFAKYYLKEELHPGQTLQLFVFDGIKPRKMIFHSREEKVNCKWADSAQTICLESTTPLSTFGDKEGRIQIWYTALGEKIPILMELDLPIGKIRFELDEVKGN